MAAPTPDPPDCWTNTNALIPVWGETRDQLMAGLDAVRRRLQEGSRCKA